MNRSIKTNNSQWMKAFMHAILAGCCFYAGHAFAANSPTITGLVSNVTGTTQQLGTLIVSIAYVAGLGFAMGSILKFKQHKDNPTQIPIGTPIALLFVSAALMFLPSVFRMAGTSIFGSEAQSGGFQGVTTIE